MPRGGTTFLYFQLQKHPNVFAPLRKETNYFSVLFDRGIEWYQSLFEGAGKDQVGMDASPVYFMDKKSIERIKTFNPDVRIILGVRAPAQWSLSFYKQVKSHSYINSSFPEFLQNHDWNVSEKILPFSIAGNLVSETIEQYKAAFGDNLLMYDYDFFNKEPLVVLNAIEKFLEIDSYFNEKNFQNIIINSSQRTNIKWLTHLLKNEKIIEFVSSLLPRKVIHFVRNRVMKMTNPVNTPVYDETKNENLMHAKKILFSQDDYVKELFKNAGIVSGSGKSLI